MRQYPHLSHLKNVADRACHALNYQWASSELSEFKCIWQPSRKSIMWLLIYIDDFR
jgi:hypothetical protein